MSNRKSKSTNKPRDHDGEEEDEMNLEKNVMVSNHISTTARIP